MVIYRRVSTYRYQIHKNSWTFSCVACSFLQVVWGLIPLPWPKQARVLRLELFKVSRNRVFASKKDRVGLGEIAEGDSSLEFHQAA